jgi:hypothetical protein
MENFKFKTKLGSSSKLDDILASLEKLPSAPNTLFHDTMEMIFKILENIVSNPNEVKFRKLKTTSSKFYTTIWTTNGAKELFLYLGFKETGEFIELADLSKWEPTIVELKKLVEKKALMDQQEKEKQDNRKKSQQKAKDRKQQIEEMKKDPDRVNRMVNKSVKDEENIICLIEVWLVENAVEYEECLLDKIVPSEGEGITVKFTVLLESKFHNGEAFVDKIDKEWVVKTCKIEYL